MDKSDKLQLFQEQKIRTHWDETEEKWYFSVIDIVEILTESSNPRDYWYRVKKRLGNEEKAELSTICRQLKMQVSDKNFLSENGELKMSNPKDNIVATKSYAFALRIIKLYKYLVSEQKEYVLSKQVLRSGTSVGALIKEAEHTQSKKDFINKMNIALKEANETKYWLMLLKDSGYIDEKSYNSIYPNIVEILKLLISIVKSTKEKLNR